MAKPLANNENNQTTDESDTTTNQCPIRQHEGLLTRQPPFAGNEGSKCFAKSQPTHVTNSGRRAPVSVDYSGLGRSEFDLFNTEPTSAVT